MQLWQDGLVAMLAAVGLASLMWAVVKLAAFPAGRCRRLAVAVVPAAGDGSDLEEQIRFLLQIRGEQGIFGRILVVDCGLSEEGRRAAGLLAKHQAVDVCQKADICRYIA